MKTVLLSNWKFSLEQQKDPWAKEPWTPGFDDSAWQDVVVPHDWAVGFPFSREHSSGTGYLPGGTGWYRTRFSFNDDKRKKVYISFDGVYKNSQVWCNGYYLGCRPNGYISFRYDISHCVRQGDDNVITVKVSHEDIADSRWYTGSGIYRKVTLEFCNPLYLKSESIVVKSNVQNDQGLFTVTGEVCNEHSATADGKIKLTVQGNEGEIFAGETKISVSGGGTCIPFNVNTEILNPKLWSDTSPNLYNIHLEIDAAVDNVHCSFKNPPIRAGIRSFRFDPDKGFFINGESRKLKGVCVHHDAGCLGAAVWPDVWRRRLTKLKEAGCNAIRASHNPHMPELYDLCDEMGFFVMEEAFDEWEGCKNKWTNGHNVYPPAHEGYYEHFPMWHERDLADMVIRGRNHPSIVMWSIGNEIDFPNDPYVHPIYLEMIGNNDANKPRQERLYNPQKPNMERIAVIAAELVKIIKKYDTGRPVLTAASFPELSSRIGFFDALDMVGYNYREQFYEDDHQRFPALPIIGSENNHLIDAWKAVRDNEYISGQFLWTGIDYMGEASGWPVRGFGAGVLDIAGNEKIGYYRRKAMWSDKPFLYLASCPREYNSEELWQFGPDESRPRELFRSWNYVPGKAIKVICYTNLDTAELFLNGKSMGIRKREEMQDCLLWTLPFERGKLEVRGPGGEVDCLESTFPAVQFRLSLWKSGSNEAISTYKFYQVELELLDEMNRLCTTENPMAEFDLTGEGKILGIENGDLSDLTEYSAPRRRVYNGRLIVFVLASGDSPVSIKVNADGIAEAKLDI